MTAKINVTPGYYGLVLTAVYTNVDDVPEASRQILEAMLPNGIMLIPATGEFNDDYFYVVQKIKGGGVIVSSAAHALRADQAFKALQNVTDILADVPEPTSPVSVMWLESFSKYDYH